MILTGKAKEDFLISLKENRRCNEKSFSEFPAIFEDALIIEWLDSVGIVITSDIARLTDSEYGFTSTIWSKGFRQFHDIDNFKSRTKATEKALEKANEIYNELKKINYDSRY